MSGTTTAFTPTTRTNFKFLATLDGSLYNCLITWNISRQDWYINVSNQSGTLIFARPLTGSPPAGQPGINLAGPWFTTSTMYFYEQSQTFVVSP